MGSLISRQAILRHLNMYTDGHIEMVTKGKHFAKNQEVGFNCMRHGHFNGILSQVMEDVIKDKYQPCKTCRMYANFGKDISQFTDVNKIDELLEASGLKYVGSKRVPAVASMDVYQCRFGHKVQTRLKEIQEHLQKGLGGCAECRAIEKNDFHTRVFNNKKAVESVSHPHRLGHDEIPARRNTFVRYRCTKHGFQEDTLRNFLKSEPCKHCLAEDDNPLEAYFKSRSKWRNKAPMTIIGDNQYV